MKARTQFHHLSSPLSPARCLCLLWCLLATFETSLNLSVTNTLMPTQACHVYIYKDMNSNLETWVRFRLHNSRWKNQLTISLRKQCWGKREEYWVLSLVGHQWKLSRIECHLLMFFFLFAIYILISVLICPFVHLLLAEIRDFCKYVNLSVCPFVCLLAL